MVLSVAFASYGLLDVCGLLGLVLRCIGIWCARLLVSLPSVLGVNSVVIV